CQTACVDIAGVDRTVAADGINIAGHDAATTGGAGKIAHIDSSGGQDSNIAGQSAAAGSGGESCGGDLTAAQDADVAAGDVAAARSGSQILSHAYGTGAVYQGNRSGRSA